MKNIVNSLATLVFLTCSMSFGISGDSIIVDSEDSASSVVIQGSWVRRHIGQGYDGTYDHDGNELKGSKSVRFIPDLPSNSTYKVYLNWVSNNNRASNVPVTIAYDGGSTTVSVNQKDAGDWVLLGSFPFVAGTTGNLLIETTATDGYVIADAAAWEAVNESYGPSEITIVATVPETTEGDVEHPALITVSRSGVADFALDLALEISGTAVGGEDYLAIAGDNFFADGESNRLFRITGYEDELVEGSESVTVTVLTNSNYTLGAGTVATVTLLDSPFDVWRAAKFTSGELADTNISGAAANPDGDVSNNLAEFFALSNPKVVDAGAALQIEPGGTGMVVSLPRNPAASYLDVELSTSSDLGEWQTMASNITMQVVEGIPLELLTYTIPENIDTKQFWGASIRQPVPSTPSGAAFWSFDTTFEGTGAASDAITYYHGFSAAPILSQIGTATGTASGGAAGFFGPDGNSWLGSGDATAPGHSYAWGSGSQGNEFVIEFSTLLQEEIHVRFDICSPITNFSALTYDTGTGPLPVPAADLSLTADGQFHEWSINLGTMDAVNGRSSVKLTWSFEDLADTPVLIDNVVLTATGRSKSQLVRNLEAGRLQTVVTLGTSITANGAWVGHLSDALETNYHGLATVLNSGASGKTSAHGVDNINSLVIQKAPDTMFIEYGINDSVERFAMSVADSRSNLEYIIDTTLASFPQCEIILMTMTPGDKYEPGEYSYRKDIDQYYAMYREVARERGFLVIDHYSSWIALQTNDVALFNSYVPDTIHPGAAGNAAVVSPVIIDALGISDQE